MSDVKAKRIEGGSRYEFTLGRGAKAQRVEAVRQPDLYFVIELSGEKHKGYLKDLKKIFAEHCAGGTVIPSSKPSEVRERARQEPEEPWPIHQQRRIDEAPDREEQIAQWVSGYNAETVSLHMGADKRHDFKLPKGEIDPPLKDCYDPRRDQYIWPTRFEPSM